MVNKSDYYYPNEEVIERFKKKTLKIVYQHELSDGVDTKKQVSTLMTVKGGEILELNEAIGDVNDAPENWKNADDMMIIWGRLKLNIPIDESILLTKDNIDFVRSALRGCKRSKGGLRYNALLFILGQPLLNDCGTVFCTDIERTEEYKKVLDKRFENDDDLKELKALVGH